MHYALLPDGNWLLVTPGAFTACICAGCLFGFAWGTFAMWIADRDPIRMLARAYRRVLGEIGRLLTAGRWT